MFLITNTASMRNVNHFDLNLLLKIEKKRMAKRRMITKYTSLSGIVISEKCGTDIWFESSLEKDFALTLEFHPTVKHFTEQPITIQYIENKKSRVYTPDFLVTFTDETEPKWLCEIKLRDDLLRNFSKYKARFKAASHYCKELGWQFKLINETHFRGPLLDNLKFLSQYQAEFVDGHCYELILNRIEDLGPTTVREVLTSISDANPSIQGKCIYAMWYCLKVSKLGCDFSQSLSLETEIWKL